MLIFNVNKIKNRPLLLMAFFFLAQITGAQAQSNAEMNVAEPQQNIAAAPYDPCPAPAQDLSSAPDDLAKVQADIDRYTLCMERAQLLQRLNSIANENQEALNKSSGMTIENPGMKLPEILSLEQRQANIAEAFNKNNTGNNLSGDISAQPIDSGDWVIMRISGRASELGAKLAKSDGTITEAKTGDMLPDGSSIVSITPTSVTIQDDNSKRELLWNGNPLAGSQAGRP